MTKEPNANSALTEFQGAELRAVDKALSSITPPFDGWSTLSRAQKIRALDPAHRKAAGQAQAQTTSPAKKAAATRRRNAKKKNAARPAPTPPRDINDDPTHPAA